MAFEVQSPESFTVLLWGLKVLKTQVRAFDFIYFILYVYRVTMLRSFVLLLALYLMSARIWEIESREVIGPMLFGHKFIVWDFCISDSLIVTTVHAVSGVSRTFMPTSSL